MSDNNKNNNSDFSFADMREIFRQYTDYAPYESDDMELVPLSEEEEKTATEENATLQPTVQESVKKEIIIEPIVEEIPQEPVKETTNEEPVQKIEEPEELLLDIPSFLVFPGEEKSSEEIPQPEPFVETADDNGLPVPEDEFGMPTSLNFATNLTKEETELIAQAQADELANQDDEEDVKGFKKFIKVIFPQKNDSAGEIIRKCVFIVSIIVVFISVGVIINDNLIEPNIAENDISEVLDIKKGESNLTWDEIKKKYPDVDFPAGMQLKYAEIYAKNPDFVGWLTIDKLGLEFPILQTDDNDYYLLKSFNHKYTELGNPFLNCENSLQPLDLNTIIYGHSTRSSDKIFSKLFDYRNMRGYLNNPIIEFNTIYKDYKWKVCAVFITSAAAAEDNGYFFNYIFTNLNTLKSFEGYVKELERRTLYTTGVDILPTDKLLTLSTCLYDIDNGRLVVVARMLREGESEEIDTTKVKLNPQPYYPQAWHDKKGTKNPYKGIERWYPE